MGKKDRYIVGLDIGTTKTCALVGEAVESTVNFVALGVAESRGWRRGQIVNLDFAVNSIQRAVEEAESVMGAPVESALVGVAGSHVRGINSQGGVTLGRRARDVEREDVQHAVEAARNVSLPEDRAILHVLPQEFLLDAQDGIRDPLGMAGQRLEASVHIVTASATATQNVVTAVNRAGVSVADTVLEPLASADACLTQDERDLGCLLLDIGGGSSELIVYTGGVVRHTAAFPVGGDHFTNDLAVGLRTPVPEAERIKRETACADSTMLGEDISLEIASVGDRPPRVVRLSALCEIVEPRAHELLTLVSDEVKRAGFARLVSAGVVLTGGAAQLRGLPELAERIFALPVRVALPRGLAGLNQAVARPEYATAVGLVLFGARARQRAEPGRANGFRGWMKGWFG